jgi:hypothetical protein
MTPLSPTPFAPSTLRGVGFSMNSVVNAGSSGAEITL